MCVEPTTALMIGSALSSAMQYKQGKEAQKFRYQQQKDTNKLAKENAIQRYASEQLKINQKLKLAQEKGYDAKLKSKRTRAEFTSNLASSNLALSGSTEALMRDYYRTEGNYITSLNRNMNINIAQYERNLEAIQFGQEAQSTHVQAPNSAMLFASAVGNVANTYYGIEMQKQNSGLMTNYEKRQLKKKQSNSSTVDYA